MKVVIMESLGISEQELRDRQKPFEDKGVVFESFAKTTDKDKLIEEAGDADAMILANMPMSADVLRACPNLKFIDIAFTGVDHVGLEAAKERSIAVSNASWHRAGRSTRTCPPTSNRCRRKNCWPMRTSLCCTAR